jgi:HPt (histidine-containing phosphotransfer) domain-containing protein
VAVLTANAITGMRDMFLEQGFSDYISKPIEVAKMDELIVKWLPANKRIKTGVPVKRETPGEESGMTIPGVDVRKGIEMTGGTQGGYRKVLSQFYKDALERLPLLKDIPGKQGLIEFATQAHALKSAAGTIGAAEVSKEAAALEAAGKAGDTAAIRDMLPDFYGHLSKLVQAIGETLKNEDEKAKHGGTGTKDDSPTSFPTLRSLLPSLKAALEAKNMKEIDRLIEEVEKTAGDGKTAETIAGISDKVLLAEYADAVSMIDSLLEEAGI